MTGLVSRLLLVLFGYLLGSIPWGLVAGKALRGIDIRDYGSGRTGATNVLRTLGKGPAAFVVAADALKGAVAVLVARAAGAGDLAQAAAGLAAVAGHNWPCFAQFRGGRGVLTAAGGLFALHPRGGLAATTAALVTIAWSRYVSLGSLLSVAVGFVTLSARILASRRWGLALYLVAGPIIYLQHADNIRRLLRGTERRIGERVDR